MVELRQVGRMLGAYSAFCIVSKFSSGCWKKSQTMVQLIRSSPEASKVRISLKMDAFTISPRSISALWFGLPALMICRLVASSEYNQIQRAQLLDEAY